jgi:hypothetical protein
MKVTRKLTIEVPGLVASRSAFEELRGLRVLQE